MTLTAQREFYFANGFSLSGGKFILQTKFYVFVAICYAAGKTILLARSIFSKDYSLKEQIRLATYATTSRKEAVQPAAFILTCNAISKRQAFPCLFFYTLHDLSPCNDEESENRQFNRPTWVDRDSSDLNFTGKLFIFTRTRPFALTFFWWGIFHKRKSSEHLFKLFF